METRLQKYLAECGVASRRKSEEYILEGRVKVNGKVITELGTKVKKGDRVEFDGKLVNKEERLVYIMLHKPEGCVTTVTDQFERHTVMDYIDIEERIFPVGRLDYDTSGLLLLTNDGELTYKLTHPKHNITKTYIATVENKPSKEEMQRFSKGLIIDGYKTSPAKIFVAKHHENGLVSLKIQIKEGRNRQVRKMCEEIGCPVRYLKRIATGRLVLGTLKKGDYRELTTDEVAYLKSL
jgi:pseudouridine synthase